MVLIKMMKGKMCVGPSTAQSKTQVVPRQQSPVYCPCKAWSDGETKSQSGPTLKDPPTPQKQLKITERREKVVHKWVYVSWWGRARDKSQGRDIATERE